MAFVLLKDEDGKDFISNTANIATIEAGNGDVVIQVHKGARVKGDRSLQDSLQAHFHVSAGKRTPEQAALDLAADIAQADRSGSNLDLRSRSPAPRKKEPYDPSAGW